MPPYKQQPPPPKPPRGLYITAQVCEWCKERVGYPCPSCGRMTCYLCLVNNEGGRCRHQPYTPIQSTGWGEVCLTCGGKGTPEACSECGGRGVVWNKGNGVK